MKRKMYNIVYIVGQVKVTTVEGGLVFYILQN
jgi:hypothetical protein